LQPGLRTPDELPIEEPSELDRDTLEKRCKAELVSMQNFCEGATEPFYVAGTEGQRDSEMWNSLRATRATASESKAFIGLLSRRSTDLGKMNRQRKHVWRKDLEMIDSLPAVNYGRRYEPTARTAYILEMQRRGITVNVQETGLWINPPFPQLACSPDGIVTFEGNHDAAVVLEIKCPKILEGHDPNNFTEVLSTSQCKGFCLKKDEDGSLSLKRTHPYYYQVQMTMDICNKKSCHFVVWSEKGIVILKVDYDSKFWKPKRTALLEVHRKIILPERFSKRAYKGLAPLVLEY